MQRRGSYHTWACCTAGFQTGLCRLGVKTGSRFFRPYVSFAGSGHGREQSDRGDHRPLTAADWDATLRCLSARLAVCASRNWLERACAFVPMCSLVRRNKGAIEQVLRKAKKTKTGNE